MQRVDVAVVGGGPAGTAAGTAAAENDADALIIEKGVPRADREQPGPDSTDAAGMLDYWVDLMDLNETVPEWVKCRELEGTVFHGPTEDMTIRSTGIESSYPNFGFTFNRARFDDWLRERAEDAGATYRVGNGVHRVDIDPQGGHDLTLRDGEEVTAEYLILADGPQRTVTNRVLGSLLSGDTIDRLASTRANHIAYQEHREFPEEVFEENLLEFWWGVIPGHTAYPWVFPNDGTVARVGLTMPIGLDLSTVEHREEYALLQESDETVPAGNAYIRRLLEREYGDEYDIDAAFPLVEDRGKRNGTETYPISSTQPIDSPTAAKIAVVGGAMGATSAFHEGGDHVAVRTGKIAGRLAALGALRAYNSEWKHAIGNEILRNVSLADVVRGHEPADWDRTFSAVGRMLNDGEYHTQKALTSGLRGLGLLGSYGWTKFGYRNHRYVQIREEQYEQ
ncbi:NAD(P)/FAD-dependent oxidoreductase [Halocatena pleomorpha]|uniref:NAD(P)/FAD-dependent oxidoreductase n=1 Tax=Halocatena pleomorpha TaxID=1785090 RepID=A0A3P3RAI4_9EURY|nr:NAD(P)/FAD-dependent oxidoreductase [Halocatena pleomorpha]RRJ30502.1 NAD(P)/FAD-dependent oxidoreductase [Halocatena pleomorpha]